MPSDLDPRDKPKGDMGTDKPAPALGFMPRGDTNTPRAILSFLALCRESISKRYQLDPRDKPKGDMGTDKPAPALGFMPRGDTYALTAALVCAVLVLTAGIANAATGGGVLRMLGVETQAGENCSNGICINAVIPAQGVTAGGENLTITGSGWPYDIVDDGLAAYYDGANRGVEPLKWKDSSGNGLDLTLVQGGNHCPTSSNSSPTLSDNKIGTESDGFCGSAVTNQALSTNNWTADNAFSFPSDNASADKQLSWQLPPKSWNQKIPTGTNPPYTIEFAYSPIGRSDSARMGGFVFWGKQCSSSGVGVLNDRSNGFNHYHCGNDTIQTFSSDIYSGIHTLSVNYNPTTPLNGFYRYDYLDGTTLGTCSSNCTNNSTSIIPAEPLQIGKTRGNEYGVGYKLHAIRIYNKALSQEQLQQNARVDRARYLAPPAIKIGGQTCQNLTVRSSTQITCTSPAHAAGNVNVEMTFNGTTVKLTSGFKYADPRINSVSPNVGPSAGNQRITVNGENFPYASVDDYSKNGLQALYDGVNNAGLGDTNHQQTSTKWVDLTGNKMDATLVSTNAYCGGEKLGGPITTLSDGSPAGPDGTGFCGTPLTAQTDWGAPAGFHFPTTNVGTEKYSFQVAPKIWKDHLAVGNQPYTVEFVYTPDTDRAPNNNYSMRGFVFWGKQCSNSAVGLLQDTDHYLFYRCGKDSTQKFTGSIHQGLHSVSTSWGGTGSKMEMVLDGNETAKCTGDCTSDNNIQVFEPFQIGKTRGNEYGRGYTMQAVRIYNRQLTADELAKNFNIDKLRYKSPPVVKVGGNPCTNVIVISTTKLTCTTPSGTAGSSVAVSIGTDAVTTSTVANGYKYAASGEPYITSTSPAQGPKYAANQVLTLTGNFPTNLTAVTVGGAQCTGLTKQNTNTYTCTIPAGSVGPKDVKVTYTGGTSQTLTSAFEYLDASNDPVKYRVQRSAGLSTGQYEYTLAGADGDGAQGPYVEPAWTGITSVTLTYPSGLTAPATPAGWTASTGSSGGNKTLTLTASTLQTSDAVAAMLKALKWTSTSGATNVVGSITAQLTNGLW